MIGLPFCLQSSTYTGMGLLFRIEGIFSLLNINVGFLDLYHMCRGWPLIDVFEQLLNSIAASLSLALNLQQRQRNFYLAGMFMPTFPLEVLLTQPVRPYFDAFCCVKELQC